MIEVKNLTKRYGSHIAVNGLSFRVEKGQIYGFLGPNGAGKSTTMNIITGYLAATEGTVTVNGRDIQKEPEEAKRCMGYLPEIPPVYTDMTVTEYLRFAAELKKVAKEKRKSEVERVIGLVKAEEMKHRLIRNLSKGYRQRVGLAQALIGDPEVIILDEPMVGLDPQQIIEIRDLILSLKKEHTVILSSHILSEVSAVCDHILIISGGKLVADDSPEGLQKLMAGSSTLELEIKGETDKIRQVLNEIDGIESVQTEDAGEGSTVKVTVNCKDNTDIREEVSFKMAENRLLILNIQYTEKSLEDIFLELTGNEPGQQEETRPEEKEDK